MPPRLCFHFLFMKFLSFSSSLKLLRRPDLLLTLCFSVLKHKTRNGTFLHLLLIV